MENITKELTRDRSGKHKGLTWAPHCSPPRPPPFPSHILGSPIAEVSGKASLLLGANVWRVMEGRSQPSKNRIRRWVLIFWGRSASCFLRLVNPPFSLSALPTQSLRWVSQRWLLDLMTYAKWVHGEREVWRLWLVPGNVPLDSLLFWSMGGFKPFAIKHSWLCIYPCICTT